MRGQHFGFLGTLCLVWIGARVGFLSVLAGPQPSSTKSTSFAATQIRPVAVDLRQNSILPNTVRRFCCPAPFGPAQLPAILPALKAHDFQLAANVFDLTAAPIGSMASEPPIFQPFPLLPSAPASQAIGDKFNVYAYSLIRGKSQGGGLLNGQQYGGSQSGFVATYALARFRVDTNQPKIALLLRGAIAHDNLSESELAAGLRWRPSRRVPVTLTAERRFRNGRNDAIALYVAGGQSALLLPLQFRLDSYAQAGVVSGKDGGPFFDVVTRAERKVADIGPSPVNAGLGAWGGGQDNVFRVDVGPTISTDLPVGSARIRVSADWRFRIAGDARPGSGPALTLSTSF